MHIILPRLRLTQFFCDHIMSFMDKKTAYNVLSLNLGATREDAKINYRKLAKIYHPDLSSNGSGAGTNDLKMKEINIAYRFLIPFLAIENVTASPRENNNIQNDKEDINKTTNHPQESFLSKVIEEVKNFFKTATRSNRRKRPQHGTTKAPMSKEVKNNSNMHFDEMLSKFHVDIMGRKTTIRKPARKINKIDSHNTYRRYMELRGKMKANKTNQNISIGRVERITPIDPVKPVNKS